METKFISTNKKIALMVALQRGEKEAIQTIINELGRLESVIKDYEIGISRLVRKLSLLALSEMAYNVLGLYAGWDFSTKAHKKYQCSTLHKCQLKVHQPTLRKTPVVGSAFLVI